jgi:hypothetical protein
MSFALLALTGLSVLIYAAKHDRGKILLAVAAMVMITGGPAAFTRTLLALVPGLG